MDEALIFGRYGFPEMGIAGAGLASTIAEYVALGVFLIYMVWDKENRQYLSIPLPKYNPVLIREIVGLSVPIVAMSVVGLGSYFFFTGLIENFGPRALAVNNIVRIAYLILSIPAWGFCTGINTLASYFVGKKRRRDVKVVLWRTVALCLGITLVMGLPLILFPRQVLYPILGDGRADLIKEAYPVFWVLLGILVSFSFGSIFFNGLIGAGKTKLALIYQTICALIYMVLIFVVVRSGWGNLTAAWSIEIVYWVLLFGLSLRYFRRPRWRSV